MTLTEFFEQGYAYFFVTAFGLLLALGTFIISFIRTQKLPLIQLIITGCFLLLIFIKPLLVMFGFAPTLRGVNLHFDLLVVILSACLILGDHVVYLLFTNGNLTRKSLFVLAPLKTGRPIYLYLNQKGKVALVNKPMLEKLELPEDTKSIKKACVNFIYEGNYIYGEFFKKLNLAEDGIVEFTIQLEGKDVKFQLEKMTIKETVKGEEKAVGSIYVGLECEECCCDKAEEPAEEEAPVEEALAAEEALEEQPQEEQPEEAPAEEQPQEEQPEEAPAEEEPQEEQPEEAPAEEEPQEEQPEEAPAEEEPQEEQPEEAPAEEPAEEEKKEEVSMDDLNKVDLDNSFLNDDEEK